MYPGQVVPKIRLLPKYKSTWPDVLDEKKFKNILTYLRNCKNLPPLLQINRHNQFLRTKPSSKDDLLFKNKFQLVIDPHVMIKLSSSKMKNGQKPNTIIQYNMTLLID